MNARLQPAPDVLARLPASDAPWALTFEPWPQAEAQRWRAVMAQSARGRLALLADRPLEPLLRLRVESQLHKPVLWWPCEPAELDGLLEAGEADYRALGSLAETFGDRPDAEAAQELSALHLAQQASPVVRLLDATLYDALQDGASDIHFECQPRGMRIRSRVDGVMLDVRSIEGMQAAEQLVSRLKVMAELDIGERRLPQDGRFKLRVQGREVDFRLSIMPSVFGEDAVVRVLDRAQVESQGALTLDALGFDTEARAQIRALARQPHGMLLVTGPTGSGKTTTLYAAISEVNTGRDKIITIEDPVEYQLPGVVQIPVNEKKGLTFARGLRSVLRHDPDRVMVGEIRDAETAQIAVQAALTGHLVFSTVHANHALDVVGRFMHMGLDLYNVVSALNGVLAQRLMRINCPHCLVAMPATPAQLRALGLPEDVGLLHGQGCPQCRGTGYRGRRAVSELLWLDDELRDLIAGRAPLSRIKEAARARGMRSLRDAALGLVLRGESTLEELERVTLAD
ncbi:GspE/PulE family protein [Roseateles puraquae]|uniref:General secretion pathway protein GspE n=1 Tax=Roseateles puraquae TaxID=431059 RepID=A0A254NA37_9BURK|nr:GspE/PulE family protein [Roseateles puraquae]MDG0857286.1 type II/IV secretion system protein [Roseateles puraquae]OWR03672.1 general secretion pathway protein GspE [Roseateles puraquae]